MMKKVLLILIICSFSIIFPAPSVYSKVKAESAKITTGPTAPSAERPAANRRNPLQLEKVIVEGNEKLSDEKIAESANLYPGDILNSDILMQARSRLLRSNRLISSAEFFTQPGSRPGMVILEISVEEKEPVIFETGYGYHDTYGWFLTLLGLRIEQPFQSNSQIRTGLKMGFHVTGLEAEWNKFSPPEGGAGFRTRFYIYNEDHIFYGYQDLPEDFSSASDYNYDWSGERWRDFRQDITRAGLEASLRYHLAGASFSFGLKAESVEPDSTFRDMELDDTVDFNEFPEEMKPDIEKTAVTGVFLRMIRDTRNSFIYPENGSYTFLSLQACNTILGGDRVFTKMELDHIKHIQIGNYRVLSSRLKAGLVSRGSPYFEKFFLGGIYSIRGFRSLSLSPATGNDGYWIFSEELRFPLIQRSGESPRLSGLIFFDAGQGWLREEPFTADEIKSAAGYGIRLRLPWFGTLGFDVGIPLSRNPNDDPYRVSGSLGFSF